MLSGTAQRRVKSGCQLFANTAAERLFGAAGAQLAGEPIEHLLPERLRARHEALRAEFLSAPRTRPMGSGFDLHARSRDGSEVPVEIALSPVTLAERTLVIAAIRDVSDRRRIEGQLGAQREAAEQARAVRRAASWRPPAMICVSRCRRWRC